MSFGRPKGLENITGPLGQALDNAMANAQINQIRGTTVANTLGSGIPKQVTNVAASVSNATTGSTNVVKVTFRRNPGDVSFSKALVYLRGYNGNGANVNVASGTDSPITFVLNNTGESVVITVQSSGNAGDAPIASAPTTGIRLPKSTGGGFGSTTVTNSITALTGDVTTSGTASPLTATVVGIEGVSVSNVTPQTGDTFRYNEYGDSKWDLVNGTPRFVSIVGDGANTSLLPIGHLSSCSQQGTASVVAPTGTEPGSVGEVCAASPSSHAGWSHAAAATVHTLGPTRRVSIRIMARTTTNSRHWIGFTDLSGPVTTTNFDADVPNQKFVGFRYSAGTDTTWKAVCQTDNTHQTVGDTTIAPDTTNSQLLEFVYSSSLVRFYVNGVLRASLSTNIPTASQTGAHFARSDNQGSSAAVGLNTSYYTITYK